MAVEDGALLGQILGRLNQSLTGGRIPLSLRSRSSSSSAHASTSIITQALQVYEQCQKRRTTTNVKGALNNRHFYHMPDGMEQRRRDGLLARHTWTDEKSEYTWCDMGYDDKLLNVDVLGDADRAYDRWLEGVAGAE